MSLPEKLIETLSKLSALEARTADAVSYVERVEGRIDNLRDRISHLEARVESLRQNVRNEILADVKSEITHVRTVLEYEAKNSPSVCRGPKVAGGQLRGLPEVQVVRGQLGRPKQVPWMGFYYVNVDTDYVGRGGWSLNVKYSYVSAGGDRQWTRAIRRLRSGDKLFAYMRRTGYVGYGVLAEEAVMLRDYQVDGKRLIDELPGNHPWYQDAEHPDTTEWVAKVNWVRTFPVDQARRFDGMFASTHVVCRLRHKRTFDFLVKEFGVDPNS